MVQMDDREGLGREWEEEHDLSIRTGKVIRTEKKRRRNGCSLRTLKVLWRP